MENLFEEKIEKCKNEIENKMIQDVVENEVRERKNLESKFQRWRKETSKTETTESNKI